MESHQLIGAVLIATGVIDAAMSMWIPNRIPDQRQRAIVRLSLLASGTVLVALGGVFLVGLIGTQTPER